jgi:acyl-CoA thioesterase FadM
VTWLETHRGVVPRWEIDSVDHFTVAYYFSRLDDATHALLHAIGLDPVVLAAHGRACVTVDCRVRYQRELRVGDILHVRSGVIAVDGGRVRLAHQMIDSDDGAVCTLFEQGMALVQDASRTPQALTAAQRERALAHRVEWAAAPGPVAPPSGDDRGFVDAARDAIEPFEVDLRGAAGLAAYIHRFSAANSQVLAAFGMTPRYQRERRRGFSTFEFRLAVLGEARAGDLVLVRSGLLHVGNSSMRLLHRMTDVRTGALVATLEQSGVHLDVDARRPTPLPPELRERAIKLVGRRGNPPA